MSDLVTWLRAQLDADERIARGARADYFTPEVLLQFSAAGDAAHVVTHDPARVLRQVAALRAIVALHRHDTVTWAMSGEETIGCVICYWGQCDRAGPDDAGWCETLRHLATVYADRDGYQPEWAPE